MTPRAKILTIAMLVVLLAGSFYLRALTLRIFRESAPSREEGVRAQLSEVALRSPSAASQTVTLYFVSPDRKHLLAEMRAMPLAAGDTDRIRQVLLALVEGPRQGSTPALPPSTEVRGVFLADTGTAYIDFSTHFEARFVPGIASECLAVYSVVNSLAANIPAVKKVRILIQGQEVEVLDAHADLSDAYVPNPALNLPGS